ncbi:MAG: hypothetical protein AB4290_18885 [Spirulina sp.]
MEPITPITAAAIISVVLNKISEEAATYLSVKVQESYQKILDILKRKDPEFVEKELQGKLNYRETLNEIQLAVDRDPEVARAVVDLEEAVREEPNQEILLQVLYNVILTTEDKSDKLKSTSNSFDNNFRENNGNPMNQKIMNTIVTNQKNDRQARISMIVGIYLSFLSFILIGLLVFIPLSIEIQQVLVAFTTLLVVFSLSAFKKAISST